MIFKLNPLGEVLHFDDLQKYLENLSKEWDEAVATAKAAWPKAKTDIIDVTKFLLRCLDGLIDFIERLSNSGPDKKATVLAAVAVLYDYIVIGVLPIWLKPFASKVKLFIVYTVISAAVDFIVQKYRDGSWKFDETKSGKQVPDIV